jgi:hypothetical protein
LGFGVWGLGLWPQSPIPNPHFIDKYSNNYIKFKYK